MEKVTVAVKEVFGALNPREEITLERLSELTLEVRKRVEGTTEEERRYVSPTPTCSLIADGIYRTCKWLPFLHPPQDQEAYVLRESGMTDSGTSSPTTTASIRRLIDETSDLIDSPSFAHVLTRILDAGFSHLIDIKISTLSYKIPPISESTARIQEIVGSDIKAKVANSLAVFCRQAHSIGSGANNEYLAAMENVRDLEAFAAVVYSSNFEFESPDAVTSTSGLSRPTTAAGDRIGDRTSLGSQLEGASQALAASAESGMESAWAKALDREDGKA